MSSPPTIGADPRGGPPGGEDGATPPASRVFALILGAVAVAAAGVQVATLALPDPALLAQWIALGIVASAVWVPPASEHRSARGWLLHPIVLVSGAALGPVAGVLVAGAGALSAAWTRHAGHRRWHVVAATASAVLGATAAGGIMAGTLARPDRHPIDGVQAASVAATAYFLVETGLTAVQAAMAERGGLARTWLTHGLPTAPGYVAGAAAAAVVLVGERPPDAWWGPVLIPALLLAAWMHRRLIARVDEERRRVRELSEVQLATIEALALAIEVKDRTGHAQMRRMQVYAEGLARAAGMREEDIAGVKTAALLLDIGNLAVPGHILDKPGALSAEEFERIKIHPRVGADLVEHVPFPYPVAHLILSHHERWDGRGYPAGHAGTAIPIGARVLAVVDTFTTLLFDRPYRRAHSFSEAVATLRQEAGRALDPDLVERFIEVLPALEVRLQAASGAWPLGGAVGDEVPLTARAFDDIAGAQREVKVLYEIAQALGSSLAVEDTVTLVASRLHRLVPFSCCALFLRTEQGRLVCRHVVGTAPAALREIEAASEEWLASLLSEAGTGSADALRSVLVATLEVGSTPQGALAVGHGTAGIYTSEHRRILDLVARQVAPVIQNSLAFEATQRASLTDPLTGLANRRALVGHVAREIARASRHGDAVTLLLLDLDGLKRLNDTHGHQAGDRAIREVADTIRGLLRAYDLCARYAGDEFVVVLAGCDAAEAEERRAELQRAVDALQVDVGRGRVAAIGVSAGAATYPADGRTIDELLSVADQRMYADKVRRQAQPFMGREALRRHAPARRAAS